jgi:hypothetical protein
VVFVYICGSTFAGIDAMRTKDGGAAASKEIEPQMQTDDRVEKPGRERLTITLMLVPLHRGFDLLPDRSSDYLILDSVAFGEGGWGGLRSFSVG